MRTNVSSSLVSPQTHEGAPASHITAEQELRRTVMSCLLWEDGFYEDGVDVADRIAKLVERLPVSTTCLIAVEARNLQHLRHVPLLLCALASRKASSVGDKQAVSDAVATVVQRADEMGELISIVAKVSGAAPNTCKRSLRGCVRRGLVRALAKFGAYQLGKYNSDKAAVKLRDVLRLCHPKPTTPEQSALWKSIVDGTLASPDTWEVALSGGADKRETFTRLLVEGKLGYFALLRNLRNMEQAGVDQALVGQHIRARQNGADKILPFRFIAAARACVQQEAALDASLCQCVAELEQLPGRTIILVDVSGSMDAPLSAKSDLKRIDAAAALASVANCETLRVFTFSSNTVEVPPRRGMAGVDAVIRSQHHNSTELAKAMKVVNEIDHERLIVITDEQSTDGRVPVPKAPRAYMINVATSKNGVGYGRGWTHIDGFSESVLTYIHASEQVAQ
jgi:60 kDa SS-A/Ro ribonucleoprotein